MLCEHCGKNKVNFRYTQIINGVKKEMALCDKCAKNLGVDDLDFNMPINFSSFLGDFLEGTFDKEFLPSFTKIETLKCNNCGMSYDEFTQTGKFGCSNCYDIFSNGLNRALKNIHGSDTHVGRRSRLTTQNKSNIKPKIENNEKQKNTKEEKLQKLNNELKQAIKEERYEDAAKIRDQIKKIAN